MNRRAARLKYKEPTDIVRILSQVYSALAEKLGREQGRERACGERDFFISPFLPSSLSVHAAKPGGFMGGP